MSKLIQNAFYVPATGIYYKSINSHDFTGCKFPDGREYYIDGGNEYKRVVGDFITLLNEGLVVDYTLYSEDAELTKDIYDKLLWGLMGKKGLVFKPVKDFTKQEAGKLINTQHVPVMYKTIAAMVLTNTTYENMSFAHYTTPSFTSSK